MSSVTPLLVFLAAPLVSGHVEGTPLQWPTLQVRHGAWPGEATRVRRTLGEALRPGAPRRLELVVPERADGPIFLQDARSGLEIWVSIEDAPAVPWQRTGTLWAAADKTAAGDELWLHRSERGLEDYRLVTRDAAGALARYAIDLPGGAHLRLVDGVVEVLDAGGAPRLRMARPYLLDLEGERHAVEVDIEGCAFDADPAPPWGRPPITPGAARCAIVVSLSNPIAPRPPFLLDPLWSSTSDMTEPRATQAIVLGDEGRVLLAGGRNDAGYLASAEIFDERTESFAVTAPLPEPRTGFGGAWAGGEDGYALLTGGCAGTATDCAPTETSLAFDAQAGAWISAPSLDAPRAGHRAISVLAGAEVLIVGGLASAAIGTAAFATTEVYDAASGSVAPGPPLSVGRASFGFAALSDGGGVVVGGVPVLGGAETASVERYAPLDRAWESLPALPGERRDPLVAELTDGRLVVAGGSFVVNSLKSSLVLEPEFGWTSTGSLLLEHPRGAGALLSSGWLVMAGGASMADVETMLVSGPAVEASWAALAPLPEARSDAATVALPSGRLLLAGGFAEWGDGALASAVLLGPGENGAPCALGAECVTGVCVDGVCCDVACAGPCEACAVAAGGAADGVCSPAQPGAEDALCAPQGECGATGACAAGGACAIAAAATPCTCDAGAVGACDGAGTCGCTGSTCADDQTERTAAGEVVACAPYRCASAACLEECGRSGDCAPGYVCDRDRTCVDAGDQGRLIHACACASGREPVGSRLLPLALALALAARRATRSSATARTR